MAKYRVFIDEALLKVEAAFEELANKIDAEVREEVAETLLKAIHVTPGSGKTVALLTATRAAQEQITKARAPWGASRAAIAETFTKGFTANGATLEDFAQTARAQGHELAMSSIRSMALDMEKAGEMRRENGRWFVVRIEIGKHVGAISGVDPTAGMENTEKETAASSPYAGETAAPTPWSAAKAGSTVAG